MTAKKTALIRKPAVSRRPAAPADDKSGKTFERSVPGMPNMRLAQFPSPSGRGVGGEGEPPALPASTPEVLETGDSPRDLILRLVETLKGL